MLVQLNKTELTGIIFEIITAIERSDNTPDVSNVTSALASAFTGEYDVSMAPDIIKYMVSNIEIEKIKRHLQEVVENLERTIAGKTELRDSFVTKFREECMTPVMETVYKFQVGYLSINIDELNKILSDLKKCSTI